MENDSLSLTEIQITNDTDGTKFFEQMSTFNVYFNSCGARYQNLAFCLDKNIVLLKHEAFPGISVVDIRKHSFSHDILRVMLLYCSPNSPFTSFYNRLENVLSDSFIDMVLGDFNIKILSSINVNLNNVLSKYTLLVNEPTYISGSLLDQVYVNNDSLQNFLLNKIEIVSIYFSDHDATKFTLIETNIVHEKTIYAY